MPAEALSRSRRLISPKHILERSGSRAAFIDAIGLSNGDTSALVREPRNDQRWSQEPNQAPGVWWRPLSTSKTSCRRPGQS